MSGYTGGAFGMWIPDSYTFTHYEIDKETAAPFILAMRMQDEGIKYGEEIATLLISDERIYSAFGRLTAYTERQGMNEIL